MSNRLADVRAATHDDLFGIRDTLEKALAEAESDLPEPDYPYALQDLLKLIASGLAWVAVSGDGRVVGALVLDFACLPWVHPENQAKAHLYNQHFWVDPKWRVGGTALRLIREAEKKAQDLGRRLMLEISYGGADVDLKDRFVKMQGFRYIGGKFWVAPRQEPDAQEMLPFDAALVR